MILWVHIFCATSYAKTVNSFYYRDVTNIIHYFIMKQQIIIVIIIIIITIIRNTRI